MTSYINRKRWEYREQANAVLNAYIEATNVGKHKGPGKQATKITGDAMFGMLRGKKANLGS